MNKTLIMALGLMLCSAVTAQDTKRQEPDTPASPRSVLTPAPEWVDERPVPAWGPAIEIKTLEILRVAEHGPSRRWREAVRHYRERRGVREGARSKRRAEVSDGAKARTWSGKEAISALEEIITDNEGESTPGDPSAQVEPTMDMNAATVVQWRARHQTRLRRIMSEVQAKTGIGEVARTPRGEPVRRKSDRTEAAQ